MLTRADKLIFNNVRLTGWQDTLQADGGNRQYFRNCYIEGNVDWIFGSAQAVFDDCDIVANGDGYVTAASTESTRSTGYVFINSRLLKRIRLLPTIRWHLEDHGDQTPALHM